MVMLTPKTRLHSLSTAAIDLPRTRAPSSIERWYVLILMCLIYAINIADRYVVSTVLEPIRLDLHLDEDSGGMLNILPLSDLIVFRPLESTQYSLDLVDRVVGFHGALRSFARLGAVCPRADRGRHRRSGRHTAVDGHSLRLFSARPAADGDDRARPGCTDRRVDRTRRGGGGRAHIRLAARVPRARDSGFGGRPHRVFDHSRAGPRPLGRNRG